MAPAKPCPFCGSIDTVREADFSTSLMVCLYYCRRCKTSFEAIKWGDASAALDLPGTLRDNESGTPST
jgi:hypothetical protein